MWKRIRHYFGWYTTAERWMKVKESMDQFWWREFYLRYPEKQGRSEEQNFNSYTAFCVENGRTI